MPVPVLTAAYAAILALLLVALSARVIQLRIIHQVPLGDGGNTRLARERAAWRLRVSSRHAAGCPTVGTPQGPEVGPATWRAGRCGCGS